MEHKERQPMVHTCTAAKGYRDLQQCRPPAKHCFISEMRKHDIKSSYGNCFAPVTSRTQPQNLRFPPPPFPHVAHHGVVHKVEAGEGHKARRKVHGFEAHVVKARPIHVWASSVLLAEELVGNCTEELHITVLHVGTRGKQLGQCLPVELPPGALMLQMVQMVQVLGPMAPVGGQALLVGILA